MSDKLVKRKLFSWFDLIIVAIVIVISVFAILIQFNKSTNLSCVVRYNGKIIDTISLSEINEPKLMTFKGDLNLEIQLEKDGVKVVNSECKDALCENMGKITNSGQSIVCLPAKLSVSLEDTNNDVDAVVK